MITAETLIKTACEGRTPTEVVSMVCDAMKISPEDYLKALMSPSSKRSSEGYRTRLSKHNEGDSKNRALLAKCGLKIDWDGPGTDASKIQEAKRVALDLGMYARMAFYSCPWPRQRIAQAAGLSPATINNHFDRARKDLNNG